MRRLFLLVLLLSISIGCQSPRVQPLSDEKPLVGVTSIYIKSDAGEVDRMMGFLSYVEAVKQAGAIPVVLPPLDDAGGLTAYGRGLG